MATVVNSKADVMKAGQALAVNANAAKSLQEIMKSNLGPRGTLKMLVGGAGQIKITKDGCVLLGEMQIQHPTAGMIARAATAQDDITGDGTTTNVMFIGELMKLSEQYIQEGLHPRMIAEGFDSARAEVIKFLDQFAVAMPDIDREKLLCVAATALNTKLEPKLAKKLTDMCTDAVLAVYKENEPIDLHMVELLHMRHKITQQSRLVRGLVLDHGGRHPDMPKRMENCYILTCNVSLEYEKTEVNSGFFYSSAEHRDKLVESERRFTDDKVKKIIDFKRRVCTEENKKTFVLLNQKGIDPPSLEMLQKEGILALRRAKRRNMERLVLACGGNAVNSVDELEESDLGEAQVVYEYEMEDDKFTFVEGVPHEKSVTVLVTGPNDHSINQIKDAVKDGLRAVSNAIEDRALVPGAGAFEIAAYAHLEQWKKNVLGKPRLGVEIFAKALLCIPMGLVENSGMDKQEKLLMLLAEHERTGEAVGIDILSGETMVPSMEGIWDNLCVKKQLFNLAPSLAQQLLLVDEVLRAGVQMKKSRDGQ